MAGIISNKVVNISAGELSDALTHIVQDEIENINKATKSAVNKGCQANVEYLRDNSPRKTGVYADGWTKKVTGDNLVGYKGTVYQAAKPSLTHLLENGHGGPAPAPPHPHIAQAFDAGVKAFEKEFESGV